MNVKILLCVMVIYFVGSGVSAVNKNPHVGYLYEKPEHALEETRHLQNFEEIVEEREEKAIEEEGLEEKEILKEEEEEEGKKEIEKKEEQEELEHDHHHNHHNPRHQHSRHHLLHHLQPPKEYSEPENEHLKEISSEEGF